MTSKFALLTEQDMEKIVENKDSQNTKRLTKVAKELFADYVKEKKLRGIFTRLEINYQFLLLLLPIFFIQCIIKQ